MSDQHDQHPDIPQASVPPPPPPVIAGPYGQQQSGRPTAALVIAIVLFVLAGLTLLSLVINVLQMSKIIPGESMLPQWYVLTTLCLGVVDNALQVTVGIGLLKMLPWARKGAIALFIWLLVMGIVSSLVSYPMVISSMPPMPSGAEPMTRIIMIVSLVLGAFISIVLYSIPVIFLTRPNVVKAFRDAGEK